MIDMVNKTKNQHTFFVDDEKEANRFDIVKKLNTHPALLARKTNRLKLEDLDKMQIDLDDEVWLMN